VSNDVWEPECDAPGTADAMSAATAAIDAFVDVDAQMKDAVGAAMRRLDRLAVAAVDELLDADWLAQLRASADDAARTALHDAPEPQRARVLHRTPDADVPAQPQRNRPHMVRGMVAPHRCGVPTGSASGGPVLRVLRHPTRPRFALKHSRNVLQTVSHERDGGPGDDRINVVHGGHDVVICGPGSDVVFVDSGDAVARDCEGVRRWWCDAVTLAESRGGAPGAA
jgi:hypothetical protein